jgi:hypothetical protein
MKNLLLTGDSRAEHQRELNPIASN